jgi:hypothetical protein
MRAAMTLKTSGRTATALPAPLPAESAAGGPVAQLTVELSSRLGTTHITLVGSLSLRSVSGRHLDCPPEQTILPKPTPHLRLHNDGKAEKCAVRAGPMRRA